jgi:hypothetical protein
MDCFVPGRVLVGPAPESERSDLAKHLKEEFGDDFEYEFGISDVLRQNGLDPDKLQKAHTLPFVGRVPEGREADMAARISRFSKMQVGGATPDYLVRPAAAASIIINNLSLMQSIEKVRARPGDSRCGQGCVVGIVDSGVDPSLVPGTNLRAIQYDALSPMSGSRTDGPGWARQSCGQDRERNFSSF